MEVWNTILFEMGGKPVLLIDLLSAVFGLTTVFLAGRNSKKNFYVGYVYTALLFFMFWQKNLYANLILQPISLGIKVSENVLGDHGVVRVHGGGFAGTIQAFVEDSYVETYRKAMDDLFGEGSCLVLKVNQFGACEVLG